MARTIPSSPPPPTVWSYRRRTTCNLGSPTSWHCSSSTLLGRPPFEVCKAAARNCVWNWLWPGRMGGWLMRKVLVPPGLSAERPCTGWMCRLRRPVLGRTVAGTAVTCHKKRSVRWRGQTPPDLPTESKALRRSTRSNTGPAGLVGFLPKAGDVDWAASPARSRRGFGLLSWARHTSARRRVNWSIPCGRVGGLLQAELSHPRRSRSRGGWESLESLRDDVLIDWRCLHRPCVEVMVGSCCCPEELLKHIHQKGTPSSWARSHNTHESAKHTARSRNNRCSATMTAWWCKPEANHGGATRELKRATWQQEWKPPCSAFWSPLCRQKSTKDSEHVHKFVLREA